MTNQNTEERVSLERLYDLKKKLAYRLKSLVEIGHPDLDGYRDWYSIYKELFERRIAEKGSQRLRAASKDEGNGQRVDELVERIHKILVGSNHVCGMPPHIWPAGYIGDEIKEFLQPPPSPGNEAEEKP